jgi:multiple sugar transport system ATP-binding protein
VLVSRPAGTPAPASGPAHIAVDGTNALLFDKETGRRIARMGEDAGERGEAA